MLLVKNKFITFDNGLGSNIVDLFLGAVGFEDFIIGVNFTLKTNKTSYYSLLNHAEVIKSLLFLTLNKNVIRNEHDLRQHTASPNRHLIDIP